MRAFAALVALCLAAAPAGGQANAAPGGRSGLVRAELHASVDRVRGGERFVALAAVTVAPGYHIYWIHPGETGLATEVSFRGQAGLAPGPARFPGPQRFASAGGVVGYGYQGSLVVSSVVAVAAELPPGPVALAVAIDYLACRADECVPGKAQATLALERATAERPARPASRALLARHSAALPVPLAALAGATARWTREAGRPVLAIAVPDGAASYFPSAAETPRMVDQAADAGGAHLRLSFSPGAPLTAAGLVAVTRAGITRYYQLAHPDGGPR